jgi:hypothetical protein
VLFFSPKKAVSIPVYAKLVFDLSCVHSLEWQGYIHVIVKVTHKPRRIIRLLLFVEFHPLSDALLVYSYRTVCLMR